METLAYSSLTLRSSQGEQRLDSIAFKQPSKQTSKQTSEIAGLAVTLALGLMPTSAQASLVQNDRCNAVADLQSALKYEGFDPGGIDGDFGINTLLAVQDFQYDRGLYADGVVGVNTAVALGLPAQVSCHNQQTTIVDVFSSGDGTTAWVDTEGSPLNVRSGPGRDYELIGSLPNGSAVGLSSLTENNWVQLSEGGWVSAAWLSFDPQASPVASQPVSQVSGYTTYTILPGWMLEDIAYYFEARGFFSAGTFLAAASEIPSGTFSWLPGDLYDLEGFLYPDTYEVAIGATPYEVIDQMLARFEAVALPAYDASNTSLGIGEWVTLASIVEREAMLYEEQPIIAGVFLNRLYYGMRLESDPTVEYALGIQQTPESPLTLSEVRTESPYNTYLNSGLPPAPIGNPGQGSLEAVLYPANTDYLFFVACYDGTHEFNYNLTEHEKDRDTICAASRG